MSVDRVVTLYSEYKRGGRGHGLSLAEESDHRVIRGAELSSLGLLRDISCVHLWADERPPNPVSLYLFNNIDFIHNDCYGKYLACTSAGNEDIEFNLWGIFEHFNNEAMSVALIRRDRPADERKFPLNIVLELARVQELIDTGLSEAEDDKRVRRVEKKGAYTLSSVLFPEDTVFGASGPVPELRSDRTYLALTQRFTVEPKFLFARTLDVQLTVYIYFYRFRDRLVGRVQTWELIVEDGGVVRDIVTLGIEAALGKAINELNRTLDFIGYEALFESFVVSRVYMLPGEIDDERWDEDSTTVSTMQGDTEGDATLIIVTG